MSLVFANELTPGAGERVRDAAGALRQAGIPGLTEVVPGYCTLMVCYDPNIAGYREMLEAVTNALENPEATKPAARHVVSLPVCYGGECGPDLPFVAQHASMSEADVIAIHAGRDYPIEMLGFLPGFAYLGNLDARLATPRLEVPRTRIEPGSVGIGGDQTGVYPLPSPGGWQIIGRTPIPLYDAARAKPVLYQAGDLMRFVPIARAEYQSIQTSIAAGTFDTDSLIEEVRPCLR